MLDLSGGPRRSDPISCLTSRLLFLRGQVDSPAKDTRLRTLSDSYLSSLLSLYVCCVFDDSKSGRESFSSNVRVFAALKTPCSLTTVLLFSSLLAYFSTHIRTYAKPRT